MPQEDKDERKEDTFIEVSGMTVQIVPFTKTVSYLGRALSFAGTEGTELSNRINCGWAKFMKFKSELCGKRYPLQQTARVWV